MELIQDEKDTTTRRKRHEIVAVYDRIAFDIANRIAKGEISEGARLSGRSTMSSEYGVSPETIRRAFSLLEEMEVVLVQHNSGVIVRSRENASKYIARNGSRNETKALLTRIRELIEEHERIDRELFNITKELVNATERFTASNPFSPYECQIPSSSSALGKTLSALRFWQKTGATVIAIRRQDSILLSPGPDFILAKADVLVVVGDQKTRDLVLDLLS
ncbi:TrkA C-terminal domain-containing protein [uncultured Sphaerochaeta sp.]|uniref:TrkA C-terminal domain-containing protein n=1 Tax=uncultured Sphaerochaeta sp. TaxID=886478 RepID=UPI002A0A8F69|nr:TrkA C-terminal domain-containing protein [uncultured Sphaerochaeta sp.]